MSSICTMTPSRPSRQQHETARRREAPRRFALSALGVAALAGVAVSSSLESQTQCPAAANAEVAAGWEQYRRSAIATAQTHFEHAAARCPGHVGAQIGLGYVALRLA